MPARSTASTATQSLLLLIARLGFAGILVGRAWFRWQVEGMASQFARVAEAGLPQPELIAWGTVLLEGIGGVLLALGFLTRLVATLVAVENILIIVLLRWSAGLHLNDGGFGVQRGAGLLGRGLPGSSAPPTPGSTPCCSDDAGAPGRRSPAPTSTSPSSARPRSS